MSWQPGYGPFGKDFEERARKQRKAVGIVGGLGCLAVSLYALLVLAVVVGIGYVAVHFIGKFW